MIDRLDQAGIDGLNDLLVGPSAVAFVTGDPVEAAKGLRDFARANPNLVIKGGVLEGRAVSVDQINRMADLESREVLLSKMAGALNASLVNAVTLFSAPLSQAARLVAALAAKREEDGETIPVAEEVSTDEAPAAEVATDEAPAAEVATDEAPAAEVATDEAPAAEVATDEAPAAEVATDEAPAAEAPAAESNDSESGSEGDGTEGGEQGEGGEAHEGESASERPDSPDTADEAASGDSDSSESSEG